MANWKPIRLYELLETIEENKIVLPVVQRELVWKEDQIELIFDTLLKGDSFGGIMTIKDFRGKKSLFDFRYFINNYFSNMIIISSNSGQLTQDISYVVDGQQRISAFHIGLSGSYNNKKLYFDLFGESDHRNYNFKFASSLNELKKDIDNYNGTKKIPTFWISLIELMNYFKDVGFDYRLVKNKIFDDYSDIITDEYKDLVDGNLNRFQQEVFVSPNIGICEVTINRNNTEIENRQNIVELFRRLNQGGTKLDGLELMASKLKGFDPKNEIFLSKIKHDFEDIGFNQDEIIKLIFLLQDDYNKNISDVSKTDSDFIRKYEDRIYNILFATRKFLEFSNLYVFYKETYPSIIPLYFIAYYIFHTKTETNQIKYFFDDFDTNSTTPLVSNWIKISLLCKVFRRRGAGWTAYSTGIRKILEIMKSNKDNPFPTTLLFEMYKSHPLEFTEHIKDDWSWFNFYDFDFVMFLIYDMPKNFRKNDIDHIHPKSILSENKVEWNKINSIANFQLLDYKNNRGSKSDNELIYWLKNNVNNIQAYIKFHLIPNDEDLWQSQNYDLFLESRKKLIIDKIKSNL
ncbi:MAG: DUF262 domain-containing protein [Spirochaetia bacterium]|nr:DUF262 domain-containing protein [Spirochaetia bacterium]